jgi:PAS domain S-box-containing protein
MAGQNDDDKTHSFDKELQLKQEDAFFLDDYECKRVEEELAFERSQLLSIFDGIDDVVYVTDLHTYEVLYANKAMRERFGGDLVGGICYREFQRRDSPCDFCTNSIILKEKGKPYRWEFYNPTVDRHFLITDRIIKWPDGRDVRFEIAKDITDRKRAEEDLRASEDKFKAIFDRAALGLAISDSTGHIIDCNSAYQEMLGYSKEELREISFLDITHLDDKSKNRDLQRKMNDGLIDSYRLEKRYIQKGGRVIICNLIASAIRNPDGTLKYNMAVVEDITERKKAEQSQALLASIIMSSDDAIFSKELDGTITSWNRGAERMYGYTAAEMVGRSVEVIVPSNKLQEYRGILEKIRRGGEIENSEQVRITKDGRKIDVSITVSPIIDGSGNIIGASTIARDITERKQADKERGISVDFLSLVNDTRNTGELIRSAAIFFQEVSGCEAVGIRLREGDDFPYYEARGFRPEFIRKENLLCTRDAEGRVLHDKDGFPMLDCMCGNVITGRFDTSKPFFTARGSFWTNSTTELLATTTENDRLARTRNVCNTEGYESFALISLRVGEERLGVLQLNDRRKGFFTLEQIRMWERLADNLAVALAKFQAEEELKDAKAQAELYLDLMGHDINNMHQIALGYLEMAKYMPASRECDEVLDKPIEVLQRSTRLIRNVQKLQKIREGVFLTQEIDVSTILADVQRDFGSVPNKTVTLNMSASEHCRVRANELLYDVVSNLVGNAIKHSGAKARIDIGMNVVTEAGRRHCRIAVEDDGPGIPDDFKGKVFNRMLKGTANAKGMGLGLYLVKSLVGSYQGKVWVEDRVPGDHTKGARFVVMLPAVNN